MSRQERQQGGEPSRQRLEMLYREEDINRFAPDILGGPVIGFVYGQDGSTVQVVTIEHNCKVVSNSRRRCVVTYLDEPVRLHYTPEQWVSFCLGVKGNEFQLEGQSINLRNSGDRTGPIIAITSTTLSPFITAIKRGKYDILSVEEKLRNQRESSRRRRWFKRS